MYLNTPREDQYDNLDSRTILDRLAAVKYLLSVREKRNICLMDTIKWRAKQRKMGKHIEHTNVTMHFHLAIRMILIFREKNMKKCL